MSTAEKGLAALASHMKERQAAVLHAWRRAVLKDPTLSTADSLPRAQLNDHVPALLQAFEDRLAANGGANTSRTKAETGAAAAAHGLHRWQQGYDLRELLQELSRLNECVASELEAFASGHAQVQREVMVTARWVWSELSAQAYADSVGEYFRLQQLEAGGHVKDLEQALAAVQALEQERARLWHEATHDLRGNLGVVVSATAGLVKVSSRDASQSSFIDVLDRNVKALRRLLDDVTDLARLQAGKERLHHAPVNVGELIGDLCGALHEQAQRRGLFLKCEGPSPFLVETDGVKIRRIAQNLILNAIKYTREGGINVRWGESPSSDDAKRWMIEVQDSGPGFDSGPGAPLVAAIGEGTDLTRQSDADAAVAQHEGDQAATAPVPPALSPGGAEAHMELGEGIGLSIVKRLAEILRASIEVQSAASTGTTFRIFLPKHYSS